MRIARRRGQHEEKERLCRELGNKDGLARSLANQASLLQDMGQPQRALPLADEAYRLATEHGLSALAGQIQPRLKSIRYKAMRWRVREGALSFVRRYKWPLVAILGLGALILGFYVL